MFGFVYARPIRATVVGIAQMCQQLPENDFDTADLHIYSRS